MHAHAHNTHTTHTQHTHTERERERERRRMVEWIYQTSPLSTERSRSAPSIACQLLLSRDPITQEVSKIQVQKEETQKRAKFQLMLSAREVIAADPGARRQSIMKRAKNRVMLEDAEERLDHATSLATQGQLHHLVDDDAAILWSEVVHKLPPECMKFVLNAAQDNLPHNDNLSVRRR